MCSGSRFSIPVDKDFGLEKSHMLDNERRTNFYLIKRYCPKLFEYLKDFGILAPISVEDYVKYSKIISDIFKINNEALDGIFSFPPRYIYNLEQMVGHFSKELVNFDPYDEAKLFLDVRPRPVSNELIQYIDSYVRSVYGSISKSDFKHSSFEAFLEDGEYWRRPASTTVKVKSKMELPEIGDGLDIFKQVKLKANNKDSVIKAVTKLEKSKVRLAFSVDTYLYLLMSYVYQPLLNKNIPYSAIGLNGSQESKMLKEIQSYCNGEYYLIPFDFEKFDHSVTRHECVIIMDAMYREVKQMKNIPEDIDAMYTEMIDRFKNLKFKHRDKPDIKYRNGLLSGLRLTAEIGTLLNRAWHLYVIKKYGLEKYLVRIYAQGDDALCIFSDRDAAIRHVMNMKREGFKCNYKKFYLSQKRCEFLRNSHLF
jgi:hypothetical protein